MKVGIITFHNGYNYGAYLQAYALSKYIASLGMDVKIINYKSLHHTAKEFWALRSKRPCKLIGHAMKIVKFGRCFRKLPLTQRIYSEETLALLSYDVVVYGSDSVWNYSSSLIGFEPAYFGWAVPCRKKIAYAASFGPDCYEHGYPEELDGLLSSYDAAGVRDANTQLFYERLTGRTADRVLDPTFLYSFEQELKPPRLKNYILVYALRMDDEKVRSIRELASKKGKTIVSVGFYNKWADKNFLGVSPFEWIGLIKHADFIITTMYHGTLFSIQLNRPFFVYYDEYRKNKIEDFMKSVGQETRASMDAVNLLVEWDEQIGWEHLNETVRLQRKTSMDFLKTKLEASL